MQKKGKVKILILPCRNFKHRIRLIKRYEKDYRIENLGQFLYMVRR